MGVSTDGQICYGIKFEEGYIFPWAARLYDADITAWWLDICGYQPPFELFTEDGYWLNGSEPPAEKIAVYEAAKREFVKTQPPLPVDIVNYCSDDFPMYILAVPRLSISNSRGHPVTFNPLNLTITPAECQVLIDFCVSYCRPQEDSFDKFPAMAPRWYLSSYWG